MGEPKTVMHPQKQGCTKDIAEGCERVLEELVFPLISLSLFVGTWQSLAGITFGWQHPLVWSLTQPVFYPRVRSLGSQ